MRNAILLMGLSAVGLGLVGHAAAQDDTADDATDTPALALVGNWQVTGIELGNTTVELEEDTVFRIVFAPDGTMQRWVNDKLDRSAWYEPWTRTDQDGEQIDQVYIYNDLNGDGDLSDDEREQRERMVWFIEGEGDEAVLVLQSETEVFGTDERVPVIFATTTLVRSENETEQ